MANWARGPGLKVTLTAPVSCNTAPPSDQSCHKENTLQMKFMKLMNCYLDARRVETNTKYFTSITR